MPIRQVIPHFKERNMVIANSALKEMQENANFYYFYSMKLQSENSNI